jgi:putative ABC transport system permease protein
MPLVRQLARGLRALLNRSAADRDIADEVENYIEEAAAAFEASGLSPEEARRAARRQLGSATAVREQVRAYGWENVVETTLIDVRHALRRLRRYPAHAVVAVLTLALGVGASTAIFSAVNPVLFKPLPYPGPERLMLIWDGNGGSRLDVTFGTYRELIARSRSFDAMTVMRPVQPTLTGVAEPERLDGQYVSADYFRVLGVRPALGRDFEAADDQPYDPNGPFVAIISDTLWRRRFNADPTLVGRQILLNDVPVTVIGIMPGGFENVLSPQAEIWSTLRYDPALPLNGREWGHHLRLLGRVRSDVDPSRARDELEEIARTQLPDFARPQWAALQDGFIASALQDELTRSVRPALLAILGAVVLLLTIACVNVTNLLLAQGAERRAELALRAALGASRSRIARQLLAETLLLASIGGVLGVVLAHATLDGLLALTPPELPRVGAIVVDQAVLAFAAGLTILIGLLVGLLPAVHSINAGVPAGVPQHSMRIAGGHQVTRRSLVVVQVALALVLLVAAGLMMRSVQRLFSVPPGFEPAGLLTMQVQTAGQRFRDADTTHRFFDQAVEAVRRVPGVTAAAFASQLPLTGDTDQWGVHFEAAPRAAADEANDGYRYAVGPGYFEAMGIPLRAGRALDEHDIAGAPLVAVINESMARRRLPGLDPIGQRLRIGPNSGPWTTVVGVVGDVTQTSLDVARSDAVYITHWQWQRTADYARWLVARADGRAAALAPAIRRAIAAIDRDQPVIRVATMDDRLKASAADRRFALLLFEAFGLTAMVLAAVGTYSLLSGSVTERTREMGVRAALGASRVDILGLVLRQGMTLASMGIVIGLVGAGITSRALVTLLFGVTPLDSATYVGVVMLLAIVSSIACGIPAWRAARVRPSEALRFE